MHISVVCSDVRHPVYGRLRAWCDGIGAEHSAELVSRLDELKGGDVLFLISCSEIVRPELRACYKATLVVHASDLPEGRGWSPHIWQILEGRHRIAVTLLEARDPVDSGDIWAQRWIELQGHELHAEINALLFDAELALMDQAVREFDRIRPRPQDGRPPTYYRRRKPEDSRLDPEKTLAEQFDLLRVADPERFPAFFDFRGQRYQVQLRKLGPTPQ